MEVASFLEGSTEVSDGDSKEGPLELSVLKFADWVRWKAGKCDTPNWWAELSTVPGEDETRRLAQEVRASFQLPRWMHELDPKEAPFQAPPVPPCLHCTRDLYLQLCPSMPARTSERFPGRRQLCMPEPCSILPSKTTC